MSTDKHTPGPWSALGLDIVKRNGDDYFRIATIAQRSTEARTFEEKKANVELIASAPALKEENARLREALEKIEFLCKERIARANYGMEHRRELQENPFDEMNYENLFGMKRAYSELFVFVVTEALKTPYQ